MHGQVFHVDTVDKHLALLYVVVSRNEVYHRTLSATALSYQGNGFSLGNHQVDVLQHINQLVVAVVGIGEGYIAEFYLVFEAYYVFRIFLVPDFYLCLQYLVDTVHGGKTFRDVVACLRELFQWIDDAVEHDEIEDDGRTVDASVVENENTSKPQYDDDEYGAQELTHRMRHLLTDVYSHDVVAIQSVHFGEGYIHLVLCTESLDDAQASECFLYHAHGVAP